MALWRTGHTRNRRFPLWVISGHLHRKGHVRFSGTALQTAMALIFAVISWDAVLSAITRVRFRTLKK